MRAYRRWTLRAGTTIRVYATGDGPDIPKGELVEVIEVAALTEEERRRLHAEEEVRNLRAARKGQTDGCA